MSATDVLRVRKDEMLRRVDAMPREVAAWRGAVQAQLDLQLHFSQLRAIGTLTAAFEAEQRGLLGQLDASGDAAAFQRACMALTRSILRGQTAWDFFRDKLDLRRSSFKAQLWAADTIAWDCHRPVLDVAVQWGILQADQLREPPLVYLGAGYSPLTWVRHSRPNDGRRYDLGETTLPIPVIEVPWDTVDNAWELLSLHHEVGHDIEADLSLRPALRSALGQQLAAAQVPAARVTTWLAWLGEVVADLCALQLGGPAFADALMHLLLLPPEAVTTLDDGDPHPTPYLRVRMAAAYIRTMAPPGSAASAHADRIEAQWQSLYGPAPGLAAWAADFHTVFHAVMDTPLDVLKGHTLRELMPYTEADDLRIRSAAGYFATGMNKPVGLRPRHCVAAARLAVSALAEAGPVATAAYDSVQARVLDLVRQGAAPGLRGSTGTPHDQFIAGFAKEMFA